jgi:acyl carrier protein
MNDAVTSDFEREIAAFVARVIGESTGRTVDLSPQDRLIDDGLLDSLSMVNLVIALQSDYGVDVDVMEIDEQNFGTTAAVARLVVARRK